MALNHLGEQNQASQVTTYDLLFSTEDMQWRMFAHQVVELANKGWWPVPKNTHFGNIALVGRLFFINMDTVCALYSETAYCCAASMLSIYMHASGCIGLYLLGV